MPEQEQSPIDAMMRQGDITGTEKPVLQGKTVLQPPVHTETWKPEEGGGALQLMTLCHKDRGVHGFCVAIEGGSWLVEECEVLVFLSWILRVSSATRPRRRHTQTH